MPKLSLSKSELSLLDRLSPEARALVEEDLGKRQEGLKERCLALRKEFEERCKAERVTFSQVFHNGKSWSRTKKAAASQQQQAQVIPVAVAEEPASVH